MHLHTTPIDARIRPVQLFLYRCAMRALQSSGVLVLITGFTFST